VIEVRGLTKRYGSMVAVDRLSFDVPPGAVTGFLGLNGSGKSTTMRMILGLDSPDAGHARIGGQPYRRLAEVDLHGLLGLTHLAGPDLRLATTDLGAPAATRELLYVTRCAQRSDT
jgi:ABC-type cobalamin/Fe3+-siderophores transport system ATPase subunit